MATRRDVRGLAATVVGWVLAAIVVYLLFGFVAGTIRILVRFALIVALVVGLAWLYLRLRDDE